jgi:type II secretory pathway pseudopilin PulG
MIWFNRWLCAQFKSQSGMTMLEVLFSFAILALVSLNAVKLSLSAQQMTQDTQLKLLAVGAARSVMEVVRTTPLDTLDDNPSPITASSYVPADLPSGAIAITTSPASLTGVDVATITVRVTWTGSKNRSRTLDLTTIKTRYGKVE